MLFYDVLKGKGRKDEVSEIDADIELSAISRIASLVLYFYCAVVIQNILCLLV